MSPFYCGIRVERYESLKAERDQLAASLEKAREALEAISTQVNDAPSCSLVATNTLAQIANPSAVLEDRDRAVAQRCLDEIKRRIKDNIKHEQYLLDLAKWIRRKFGLEE